MTIEIINYPNMQEAKEAKKRNSHYPSNNFRAKHTDIFPGGNVKITWDNQIISNLPKKPQDMTDRELANKITDDDVTFEIFKEWVKRNALKDTATRWDHFKGIFRP